MNSPFKPTEPVKARLSVEDFLLLDAHGSFADYAKTELIEGEIFYLNAQHRPHARVKTRLANAMAQALEHVPGLEALVEGSVEIPSGSVPEPDIVVTDQAEGEGLIPLASVRLVVEVADATLRSDLGTKARLYAKAGIPEYWVVDIGEKRLRQHWSAKGEAYADFRETPFGGRIEAVTIEGLTVDTSRL